MLHVSAGDILLNKSGVYHIKCYFLSVPHPSVTTLLFKLYIFHTARVCIEAHVSTSTSVVPQLF